MIIIPVACTCTCVYTLYACMHVCWVRKCMCTCATSSMWVSGFQCLMLLREGGRAGGRKQWQSSFHFRRHLCFLGTSLIIFTFLIKLKLSAVQREKPYSSYWAFSLMYPFPVRWSSRWLLTWRRLILMLWPWPLSLTGRCVESVTVQCLLFCTTETQLLYVTKDPACNQEFWMAGEVPYPPFSSSVCPVHWGILVSGSLN